MITCMQQCIVWRLGLILAGDEELLTLFPVSPSTQAVQYSTIIMLPSMHADFQLIIEGHRRGI